MAKKVASPDLKNSTEIGDFVKTTLSSVFQAVDEANNEDMTSSGLVIRMIGIGGKQTRPIGNQFTFQMPEKVSFDIAVTASESSTVNGGIDLKIAKLGSDLGGAQSKVSRVNFEIPITKNSQND